MATDYINKLLDDALCDELGYQEYYEKMGSPRNVDKHATRAADLEAALENLHKLEA